MQKITKTLALVLLSSASLLSCGDKKESTQEETPKKDSAKVEATPEPKAEEKKAEVTSEQDLKAFLYSKEGTYGWRIGADLTNDYLLDFFKDGRLAVQGPDGEATMWEGKWNLAGDQLTLECKDCGKMKAKETLTAKIDGEKLVLGDKVYTRYAPE